MWYMFTCQPLPEEYKWLAIGFCIGLLGYILFRVFTTPVKK